MHHPSKYTEVIPQITLSVIFSNKPLSCHFYIELFKKINFLILMFNIFQFRLRAHGMTGRQGMFTPSEHLITPLRFFERSMIALLWTIDLMMTFLAVHVCSAPVL